MRALVAQGELDIMLTSAANGERLAQDGSLGDMTLAVRGNDSTDIWNSRGGRYPALPSRPFRTADLSAVRPFCDLVLYSMTFNNELDHDLATLEAYGSFRREAAALGIRHFLEVFNPNAPAALAPGQVGAFVNDSITRALAGVTVAQRPLFLKVAYNGPDALAELAGYDPSLVVGILGGSAGTTGHLRTAAPGRTARRAGRPVRTQDPARGVAAGPGRPDAAGAAGRAESRRRRPRLPRCPGQGRDRSAPRARGRPGGDRSRAACRMSRPR
jgi:hypothetical protein